MRIPKYPTVGLPLGTRASRPPAGQRPALPGRQHKTHTLVKCRVLRMHSVELTGNPLSGAVGAAQIAALRDRGVTVRVLTPDMETRYDIYMVPLGRWCRRASDRRSVR